MKELKLHPTYFFQVHDWIEAIHGQTAIYLLVVMHSQRERESVTGNSHEPETEAEVY